MIGCKPNGLQQPARQCTRTAALSGARVWRQSAPHSHSSRNASCQGLFDGAAGFFSGGAAGLFGGAATTTGFLEKPLYNKREMLTIGDLEVSPMGLGTWSW